MLDRAEAHARGVADRVHRRARIALRAQDIARGGDHLGARRGAAGSLAASGLGGGRRHAAIMGDSVLSTYRRDGHRVAQSRPPHKTTVTLTSAVRGRIPPVPSAPLTFRKNPLAVSASVAVIPWADRKSTRLNSS